MTPVTWIVFDAVGTLLTPTPSVAEIYHAVGVRHGSRLTVDEIRRRFRKAFPASEITCFSDARRGRTSEAEEFERWRWIVSAVLDDVRDPADCFRELWQAFAEPSAWRVYADVAEVLASLKERGFRLAIASNFDSRLYGLIAAYRDEIPVDVCCVSSELGFRKPIDKFYAALIRRLDVQPQQILMVGDDLKSDVLAPRESGIASIHLDRSEACAEGAISDLTPLLQMFAAPG